MKSINVPVVESWERIAGMAVTETGELQYWVVFCSAHFEEKTIKEHIQLASLVGASVATLKEIDMCINSFPELKVNTPEGVFVSAETIEVYVDCPGFALYVRRVPVEEQESSNVPPTGSGSISVPLNEQRLNAGGN